MFENVGAKLKAYAKVICWIGIILSVISGIVLMADGYNGSGVFPGLLIIIVGSLASWIGSLGIYGFGELVENSDIRTNLACKADMERGQEKEQAE